MSDKKISRGYLGLKNLTNFMWRLSWNLGASTSWNPQGTSRTIEGLFCPNLYPYHQFKAQKQQKCLILPPLLCSTRTGCLHICCPRCISSQLSCPNFRRSWALLWSCLARRCLQSASTGFRRELPRLCTTTFRWTRYRLLPVISAVLCDPLMIRRWSVDQAAPYFCPQLACKYYHTSLSIETLM